MDKLNSSLIEECANVKEGVLECCSKAGTAGYCKHVAACILNYSAKNTRLVQRSLSSGMWTSTLKMVIQFCFQKLYSYTIHTYRKHKAEEEQKRMSKWK